MFTLSDTSVESINGPFLDVSPSESDDLLSTFDSFFSANECVSLLDHDVFLEAGVSLVCELRSFTAMVKSHGLVYAPSSGLLPTINCGRYNGSKRQRNIGNQSSSMNKGRLSSFISMDGRRVMLPIFFFLIRRRSLSLRMMYSPTRTSTRIHFSKCADKEPVV